MLQIIKCLLIAQTMYLTYADIGYKIQWEDNNWMNCETKTQIQPTKCSEDELHWEECYKVPNEGLCTINDIKTTFQGELYFYIAFELGSRDDIIHQYDIEINRNRYQWLQQAIQSLKLDSNSISIKIITPGLVISGLTIRNTPFSNNSTCDDTSFYFNYQCLPEYCLDQISSINSSTHTGSTSQIDQITNNLQIISTFSIPLIYCLVPKVYLTKSIEDNTITTILPDEQVNLDDNDNRVLYYYLTPSQYQNCENFQTQEAIVYQCYIGIALAVNKVTQYLLMLISQIIVQKSTNAYTNSIQTFEIPTSNSESFTIGPIIIFSDASNSIVDTNSMLIQTTQTIIDPNYQDYQIHFLNAKMTQNSNTIDLKLEEEQQTGSIKVITLSYDSNNFDQQQNYSISIRSSLTMNSTRRLLGQRNIIPQLQIRSSVDGNKVEYQKIKIYSNQESTLQGGYLALIFIAVLLFSLLFIIVTILLLQKVDDKYFKIKQNEDKKTPTDIQSN
ncbi:unnamed protein product (macronuclear) [Paramecium tetraurelia]|uniref:Transmembrane protein n=1 Tax=Paramecium tetraurelia TaxID=5888 RepID=A0BNF2_PARTE|nr:uncharacterized protein GSPATT00030707001 [Paramecium tetraurelia]CAK60069.1 unnamed protein product [Paramecium tetraurelia]|eukprot:XP_001427467.1 hypothetical protein (macronuclear) [Paramecium tetraurelia strain d4-2]